MCLSWRCCREGLLCLGQRSLGYRWGPSTFCVHSWARPEMWDSVEIGGQTAASAPPGSWLSHTQGPLEVAPLSSWSFEWKLGRTRDWAQKPESSRRSPSSCHVGHQEAASSHSAVRFTCPGGSPEWAVPASGHMGRPRAHLDALWVTPVPPFIQNCCYICTSKKSQLEGLCSRMSLPLTT